MQVESQSKNSIAEAIDAALTPPWRAGAMKPQNTTGVFLQDCQRNTLPKVPQTVLSLII